MAEAFACPACGAMNETDGKSAAIRCSYCGQSVVVPPDLRVVDPSPEPVYIKYEVPEVHTLTPAEQANAQRIIKWVLVIVVVTTVVPILFSIVVAFIGVGASLLPLCLGGAFAGLGPLIALILQRITGR